MAKNIEKFRNNRTCWLDIWTKDVIGLAQNTPLTREAIERDQTEKLNRLFSYVRERSPFYRELYKDFPEDMIAQEQDNIIAENAETAAAYGMTTQSFFDSAYGMSLEEAAKENLKFYCVVSLLQKELKIEVTDQDVQDYINKMIADSDSFSSADDVYEVGYTDEIIKNNY